LRRADSDAPVEATTARFVIEIQYKEKPLKQA
jgi:hypothetical protein